MRGVNILFILAFFFEEGKGEPRGRDTRVAIGGRKEYIPTSNDLLDAGYSELTCKMLIQETDCRNRKMEVS